MFAFTTELIAAVETVAGRYCDAAGARCHPEKATDSGANLGI